MFLKYENNQITYPYTIADLFRDNPTTSFPSGELSNALLAAFNVFKVAAQAKPPFNRFTHKVINIDPMLVDGQWIERWQTVSLTQQEAEQEIASLQESITTATQERLDSFARTRNYDGILSACTYATSSVQKFQVEGSYCVAMRDATWNTLYNILNQVQLGNRPIPNSFSEIESELPILEWPN